MLPMCYDTSVIFTTSTVSSMLCEVGTNEITIILAYRFNALTVMKTSLWLFMVSIIAHLTHNSDWASVNWQ